MNTIFKDLTHSMQLWPKKKFEIPSFQSYFEKKVQSAFLTCEFPLIPFGFVMSFSFAVDVFVT